MKYVRPLLEKDFVETMASWPIVRWTVPRLGIAYAWASFLFLLGAEIAPFNVVPAPSLSNDSFESKEGMAIRKRLRTTISC